MSINIKINAENIGNHTDMKFDESVSHSKMAIFALNGSGKSTISRMFRLCSLNSEELQNINSDDIVTFNANNGRFEFNFYKENPENRGLSIKIEKGKFPTINNETRYIFHTFNSDYVSENIKIKGYNATDGVDGEILLSSDAIDIDGDEKELEYLYSKRGTLYDKFNGKGEMIGLIHTAQEKIIKIENIQGVKQTNDYKEINFETLTKGDIVSTEKSFVDYKLEFDKISSMDDTLNDVNDISLNLETMLDIIASAKEHLQKPVTPSNLSEEFKNKIKANHDFYDVGQKTFEINSEKCPFCEQTLTEKALETIDRYIKFFKDEEGKSIKQCEYYQEKIDGSLNKINNLANITIPTRENSIGKIKNYFPENTFDLIPQYDFGQIKNHLDTLSSQIQKKRDSIQNSIDITDLYSAIMTEYENMSNYIANLNGYIAKINKSKNDARNTKLNIKRNICKSVLSELYNKNKNDLGSYNKTVQDINKKELEIKQKKESHSKNKKELVGEVFQKLIQIFFQDKYTYEQNTSSIKLDGNVLNGKVEKILSDGEKTIMAFCFYLAQTHAIIESESDYEKIFFIIDDPISSLDATYMYKVGGIFNDLKNNIGVDTNTWKDRYIILTHNAEFMRYLVANNITKNNFKLQKNRIEKMNNRMLLIYEMHLQDVHAISQGNKLVSHTTPNSIRHILETIARFEGNVATDFSLNNWVKTQNYIKGDAGIVSIAHDFSHGGARENTLEESSIKESCNNLIKFIKSKYPQQLKTIWESGN